MRFKAEKKEEIQQRERNKNNEERVKKRDNQNARLEDRKKII
jgi:hypothetical protein